MSLCPNLWVIVSTCITKWAQSHLGSLRKSEHGCHRVTLEDHYTFHGNTSLKTEGCTRGITLCTKPSYFYTDRHTREDEAMFNLWCSSWKGLQLHAGWRGVGERGRCQRSSEDHSEMMMKSNEAVLHVLSESFYAAEQLTTARRDLFRKEGSKITFSFTELKYGTFWIYMKNVWLSEIHHI